MPTYTHVRFIGLALPTVPDSIVPVGNPKGSGALAGTYRALSDTAADITARVNVMKTAIDTAFSKITVQPETLNIFVAPEFFWHGVLGPYVHSQDDPDPADLAWTQLTAALAPSKYPNTLFILGTMVSAQIDDLASMLQDTTVRARNDVVKSLATAMTHSTGAIGDAIHSMLFDFIKLCHAYPAAEVRNRAFIFSTAPAQSVSDGFTANQLVTEKYYASNEDFVLWDVQGRDVITEQSIAYRRIDLTGGDLKTTAADPKAIFQMGGLNIGVEICLDHADQRLRRSTSVSPWPTQQRLDIHIVPSCGMQLQAESIAAQAGGLAFNCDGEYTLQRADSPTNRQADLLGVPSLFADCAPNPDSPYGAHTQLTRIHSAAIGEDTAEPGAQTATFHTPTTDVTVIPLDLPEDAAGVFVDTTAAIHIYGLEQPLPANAPIHTP